uniref:Uncharacterized protein n=1 Tax=Utricularia reniformis TaxID=192314 RepID=A0A1Y0B152_9LAMI|nr:hypothetical protein AEK19_MT0947 [Utricularia reniformis]ART31172.1 hypothetical protein AEK19_MT0947 [Utricularia reniformis]
MTLARRKMLALPRIRGSPVSSIRMARKRSLATALANPRSCNLVGNQRRWVAIFALWGRSSYA